jgi:hypothetical protein
MTKEELLKFIENLEIADVSGFNLLYYSKEKNKFENFDNRDLRSINYNFDIKRELESMRRRVDDNYEMLNKNMIYIIDEKLNERGVK